MNWPTNLMNTVPRREPLFNRGHGARLFSDGFQDAQEPGWLDFFCDSGAASMGYGCGEQEAMLRSFIKEGLPIHVPNILRHRRRERAASLLCTRTEMNKVFFCNSGSEAVEAAIKLARVHSGRVHIWTMARGFHGRTYGALAASDGPPYHTQGFGPMPMGFHHFDFIDEIDFGDAAAVLLSPVFVNHDLLFNDELLKKLRKQCNVAGVLLIFDEVQTGMGRCGHYTYAQECGVKPDIIAMAKGLGMGYPVGATLAHGPVSEAFRPGAHFSTFGGGPLACHAVSQMVEWVHENREDIKAKGRYLVDGLAEIGLQNVRMAGLLVGAQMDQDVVEFAERCFKKGLIIGAFRDGPGTVKLTPPLNVTRSELDEGLEIMKASL